MSETDLRSLVEHYGRQLGATPNNIRKWRLRERVPPHWRLQIIELALEDGTALLPSDLEAVYAAQRAD